MPLRVATLNIWNRMGPWEQRLAGIRAGIRAIDPDVIGLQEVVRVDAGEPFDQAALIADGFGYHAAFGKNDASDYPMGNAILSRWPIARTLVSPLPRAGTDEHRSLLFVELDSPHGMIHVFCTHLNWKLDEGHVREVQVRYVADTIASLAPPGGFPPILVGDLNAEPDADEIRFLRGLTSLRGKSVYFADAYGIAGDQPRQGGGATFTRRNPFAAPLREPDRRIDYVFVRNPDEGGRGEPLDARVCFDAPHEGVYPSDHFGVVATIGT